jgi:hypothetical protein
LLAGARRFAPRAALLLTRREGWLGWGAAGFDSDADPIAGSSGGFEGEALSAVADGRAVVRAEGEAARRLAVELGLPVATTSCMIPLVLRDRIAAVLYVDRHPEEADTPLAALQLLTSAAAARLELQPLSQRASTPTFATDVTAVAEGLPLWGADAAVAPAAAAVAAPEAPPAEAPSEAEERASSGFTFVADEPEAPAAVLPDAPEAPEADEALDSTDVSELFGTATEAPAEAPSEPAPTEPTAEEFAAEFVPVEEEMPLMPGETVFEIAPEAEAEPIEIAPEEPVAEEPEVSPEEVWQAEEGEATAYHGTYTPTAEPEAVEEIGETTSPIPAADEIDLSETRAIPTGAQQQAAPPAPPAAPEPEPESPAATMAFEAPSAPESGARVDLTEDATVMIDRSQQVASDDATVMIDRSQTVPAPPAPPEEEDSIDRTAARASKTTEVSIPPDVSGPGLAFTSTRGARATGDNALHDEARRLARLLISEIKLYNEEQVEEGRRNRDLYHRLKDDIDRSRQIYEERVHESVRESSDYFQQELVRSLAGGDSRALGV